MTNDHLPLAELQARHKLHSERHRMFEEPCRPEHCQTARWLALCDRLAAARDPRQDDAQLDGIRSLLEEGHFGSDAGVIQTLLARLAGVEHQRDAALRAGRNPCGHG